MMNRQNSPISRILVVHRGVNWQQGCRGRPAKPAKVTRKSRRFRETCENRRDNNRNTSKTLKYLVENFSSRSWNIFAKIYFPQSVLIFHFSAIFDCIIRNFRKSLNKLLVTPYFRKNSRLFFAKISLRSWYLDGLKSFVHVPRNSRDFFKAQLAATLDTYNQQMIDR